jgi:hypothetical protein
MYFKKFPKFLYDFKINGENKVALVKDITQNVRIRTQILENITLYDEYDIKDGETPEIIAEKIYGSPEYHWVVMLCNHRFDYINDFPLSTHNLEEHITQKYGAGNEYNVHHYIDSNGNIVDSSQGTPVSNYQFEDDENEKKRRIKLISPELLQTILKNFKELI